MNHKIALLASLAVLTMTPAAFAADSNESTSVSSTDAEGTSTSVDQKVKVKNHADGTTDTTVKTKATKDPKGLFNKSKAKSKETVTTDKDGNVIKDKKSVSGNAVEETK